MKKAPGLPPGPSHCLRASPQPDFGLDQAAVTVFTVEIQAVATDAFAKQ